MDPLFPPSRRRSTGDSARAKNPRANLGLTPAAWNRLKNAFARCRRKMKPAPFFVRRTGEREREGGRGDPPLKLTCAFHYEVPRRGLIFRAIGSPSSINLFRRNSNNNVVNRLPVGNGEHRGPAAAGRRGEGWKRVPIGEHPYKG